MVTRRLAIKEIMRVNPISIVGPGDFLCELRGEIDVEEVLRDPRFTLYCFDLDNGTAIFVESGDPAAVDHAVFYYQGQVEHATGLVSMPLPIFHTVAERIAEPPKGFLFVHSVGRCGSTLLSKALDAVPGVHSISEPDDLSQLSRLSIRGQYSNETTRALLKSSVRWRGKPRIGVPAEMVAIKMRSEVLAIADQFAACFGQAKHFFLYRDAVSWMRTIFRGFPADRDVNDQELNRKMEAGWGDSIPLVREMRCDEAAMNPVQIRILAWITCMEGYLRLLSEGVPIRAARFEDLTATPVPILRQFFEFCDVGPVNWDAIHEVLGRDSQAGSIYDREKRKSQTRELTEDLIQDVKDSIATRPLLRVPGVVLPGTLACTQFRPDGAII